MRILRISGQGESARERLDSRAVHNEKEGSRKHGRQKTYLTYAGLKQYEDELQNLKVVKSKVAQKIKEAREQE